MFEIIKRIDNATLALVESNNMPLMIILIFAVHAIYGIVLFFAFSFILTKIDKPHRITSNNKFIG